VLALEISVNGQYVLTAGVPRWRAMTANISAQRRGDSDDPRMSIDVFAVCLDRDGDPQSVGWQPIRIEEGDVVTVRAIETSKVSLPDGPGPGGRLADYDGELLPEKDGA
jgi:hypothetical protein